jgi:hypothetical protein
MKNQVADLSQKANTAMDDLKKNSDLVGMGTAKAKEAVDQAKGAADQARDAVAKGIETAKVRYPEAFESAAEFAQRAEAARKGLEADAKKQLEAGLSSDDSLLSDIVDRGASLGIVNSSYLKQAAEKLASKQLAEAVQTNDPKKIKGAMVAARKLQATHVPEFEAASAKYRECRKLPPNWNVQKMALTKGKMYTTAQLTDVASVQMFQALLDSTLRPVYTRDRRGEAVPSRLLVDTVYEVQNGDLWADYCAARELVRAELADASTLEAEVLTPPHEDVATNAATPTVGPPLEQDVGEVYLFHGTKPIAADKITRDNFRVDLAGSSTGTLYGRGIYLGEHCTKADEYAAADANGLRTMLVCRVTLGRSMLVKTVDTDPRACENACVAGPCSSVLGDRIACRGTFREFVVFDSDLTYAAFVIKYRRVD